MTDHVHRIVKGANGVWCATHDRLVAECYGCPSQQANITCEHGVGTDVMCADCQAQ